MSGKEDSILFPSVLLQHIYAFIMPDEQDRKSKSKRLRSSSA
jgi:hypothetical protein